MLDNCPRCLQRDITPTVDAEDYNGNPRSAYRCPRCLHTWFVHRVGEPEPDRHATYDDPDAWEADDDFRDYDRAMGWI